MTVEWARDARGRLPAKEFYDVLDDTDKAKLLVLFKRMADTGKISNQEKFKKLTNIRRTALYEFKSFQLRVIGGFVPGSKFLLALGVRKKRTSTSGLIWKRPPESWKSTQRGETGNESQALDH